jgi:effector-binding domain-containing protein
MITQPAIEDRKEQPYVGIRRQIPMQALPAVIPQHIGEVAAWLQQQRVEPDGPPLVRYHVCPPSADMASMLDIAVGWPVATGLAGNDRIIADVLPAGRYVSLVYTGIENGIKGNGALIAWAAAQGIQWDRWDAELGDAFGGRVEFMLDGPEDDPDPANWKTEVAIKLADNQAR